MVLSRQNRDVPATRKPQEEEVTTGGDEMRGIGTKCQLNVVYKRFSCPLPPNQSFLGTRAQFNEEWL